MIRPTVGRVVWYCQKGIANTPPGEQPLAAQIAFVHNDTMVNIGYLDKSGNHKSAQAVPLMQEGMDYPAGHFCVWMPYQQGQAAKTEKLEEQLARSESVAGAALNKAVDTPEGTSAGEPAGEVIGEVPGEPVGEPAGEQTSGDAGGPDSAKTAVSES